MRNDLPVVYPPAWVEICTLSAHVTAEGFLKDVMLVSGQAIKAANLEKTWLRNPLTARQILRVPLTLINRQEIWPLFEGPRPGLIDETDEFVAIHKPAEVHTHPVAYDPTPNLLSWLVTQHRHDLLRVNQGGPDRGCLYRLDGPTSGLVLYAKSEASYQEIRGNFAQLFHKKIYLCIVAGQPGSKNNVEHFLAPFGPKGASMKAGLAGQRALLSYHTLAEANGHSLVAVELKTGIRHQIRVQMAALGFPLLGDTHYGGASAERMFLHCYRYELQWKGKSLDWTDENAELFERFFDLNGLLQMVLDKFR